MTKNKLIELLEEISGDCEIGLKVEICYNKEKDFAKISTFISDGIIREDDKLYLKSYIDIDLDKE